MYHSFEGLDEGPVGSDSYKRAIHCPAPSNFSVEMLPPTKMNGSYNYGMRIYPIAQDRLSTSSPISLGGYDIWRRWEDCLAFQSSIEEEYRRMARAKRQRLLRGKGVKRDGFYKQDAASSWESLPPGPDPNSVGQDIHNYIPVLTKKGTVFRASQATIDQRAMELTAFIQDLWKDEVPALINELRTDRLVLDFFSYWRRDHDLCEKQRRQRSNGGSKSRTSITSSIFSMYFSSSNSSTQNLGSYPEHIATSRSASTYWRSPRDSSPSNASRTRKSSTSSSEGSPLPSGRRRAYSTGSSNFSVSTPSDSSQDSPRQLNISVPAVADDVPTFSFDHNPQWHSDNIVHERPTSALAMLPEDQEVCLKSPCNPPPITKRRGKGINTDRHGMIFLSPPPPPDVPSPLEEGFLALPDRSVRDSWQTTDSAEYVIQGMDITMPAPPSPTETYSHRASMASIATFRTDVTADGVLPRLRDASPSHSVFSSRARVVSGPVSISEFEDDWSDPEGDILDTFLADSFPLPCFDIPRVEIPQVLTDPPVSESYLESYPSTPQSSYYSGDEPPTPSQQSRVPLSPAKSAKFSVSTTLTSMPDKLTIKAKFNDSLILLRVSDDILYKDLRQRLFNKFVSQEGVPLSDSFKITFLQPVVKSATTQPDLSDSTYGSSDSADTIHYPVTSQADWENVAACIAGYKLTLHVSDKTT